jgi:hypothetical protein
MLCTSSPIHIPYVCDAFRRARQQNSLSLSARAAAAPTSVPCVHTLAYTNSAVYISVCVCWVSGTHGKCVSTACLSPHTNFSRRAHTKQTEQRDIWCSIKNRTHPTHTYRMVDTRTLQKLSLFVQKQQPSVKKKMEIFERNQNLSPITIIQIDHL